MNSHGGSERSAVARQIWAIAGELAQLHYRSDQDVERAVELLAELRHFPRRQSVVALLPLLTAEAWDLRLLHRGADRARYARLAASARDTLSFIVGGMDSESIISLDASVREMSLWAHTNSDYWRRWDGFEARELPTVLPVAGSERLFALAAFASHRSGYVREAALWELAKVGENALPFLLLRTNDWVVPIRVRATTAVTNLFSTGNAEAFIASLPVVLRLRGFSRVDHSRLVDEVVRFVGAQPKELLANGLRSSDRHVRRAVLTTLAETGGASLPFVTIALRDEDVLVRMRAARILAEHRGSDWEDLQERLCTDRLGRLRALGLELLLERAPARADPYLEAGLHDSARSVRELARFHLSKKTPQFYLAEHYRRLVDEDPCPGAIAGLGEVGDPDDWERLFPMLDERPALARAAVVAMGRLNASESRETRLMMVGSSSPGVSKDAATSLRGAIWGSDEEALAQYLESHDLHVRRNAVRLLRQLPGWTPARRLLAVRDEELRTTVEGSYRRWVRRKWARGAPPNQSEVVALRDLARTSPLIGENERALTLRLLDFIARP